MIIQCSTKVCSFGKQVVEKVETEYAIFEGGRYLYKIHRSPMCEYMINFIHKLKHLPEKVSAGAQSVLNLLMFSTYYCIYCIARALHCIVLNFELHVCNLIQARY